MSFQSGVLQRRELLGLVIVADAASFVDIKCAMFDNQLQRTKTIKSRSKRKALLGVVLRDTESQEACTYGTSLGDALVHAGLVENTIFASGDQKWR